MFLDKFDRLTYQEFKSVLWEDHAGLYDEKLAKLCARSDQCLVLNPDCEKYAYFIQELPDHDNECLVFYYRGQWVAKLFNRDWKLKFGYISVDIKPIYTVWRKNPEIDNFMNFIDNPLGKFEPDPWDCAYTLTWYMDPLLNPTQDKIWVMTCECVGFENKGIKDMGYLSPDISIEFNSILPEIDIDVDAMLPAYWELSETCAISLNQNHIKHSMEKIWVVKITPNYRETVGWKWIGEYSPDCEIIYNPDLPLLNYDIDIENIDVNDFNYDCVYLLDRSVLPKSAEDIWAVKLRWKKTTDGIKILGYIKPNYCIEQNPDIPDLHIDLTTFDEQLFTQDLDTTLIWYADLNLTNNHKIWAVKKYYHSNNKEIDMGFLTFDRSNFDVFFICFDEPNAEINWQRLREICPRARRIKGVKGILESHQAAAKKAKTDMFYVVDADNYVLDDFKFDYEPSIFERGTIHVWHSKNLLNKNVYGYGGIKLFPTDLVKGAKDWKTDLTTNLGPLKIVPNIGSENRFNSSELITWRSYFREIVKLSLTDDSVSEDRLSIWEDIDFDQPFAEWAGRAVMDAKVFLSQDYKIELINDYQWLNKFFKEKYQNV